MGKKRICVIGGCGQVLAKNNDSSICHAHRADGANIYFVFGGLNGPVEIVYDKDLGCLMRENQPPVVVMPCWVDGADLMAIVKSDETLTAHEDEHAKELDEIAAPLSTPSGDTLLILVPSLVLKMLNLRQAEQAMISE